MGYWKETLDYVTACETLAHTLFKVAGLPASKGLSIMGKFQTPEMHE